MRVHVCIYYVFRIHGIYVYIYTCTYRIYFLMMCIYQFLLLVIYNYYFQLSFGVLFMLVLRLSSCLSATWSLPSCQCSIHNLFN